MRTLRGECLDHILPLEDAQLAAEDQPLESEVGVRASAIDEGIEEQTEDGMVESEKHDRASWQVGSSTSARPASEFVDRTLGVWLDLDRREFITYDVAARVPCGIELAHPSDGTSLVAETGAPLRGDPRARDVFLRAELGGRVLLLARVVIIGYAFVLVLVYLR